MSGTATEEEEARAQLKQALVRGDLETAQKVLLQNPDIVSAQQRAQLMLAIQQAQVERYSFGLTRYRNDLQALARKVE